MNAFFQSVVESPINSKYEGQDADEKILYILRQSFIFNFTWLFTAAIMIVAPFIVGTLVSKYADEVIKIFPTNLPFILVLFWYIFTIGFIFESYINWYFNLFIITNKKIVDMDFMGLLYKNISEAPLENIEDVTSNINGALGTVFDIGNVFVQTAAEKTEFDFNNIDNPSKIRDIISDLVLETRKNKYERK